ncbi:MAG: ATP-grasp domain-containing protein [bacterium]
MKPRTLLIIGAGIEQVRAYELAREMGLRTVGSDRDRSAPAFALADDQIIASTRDVEATVRAAKAFHRRVRIDGVMTLANDVPLTVATVAAELGLPGISITSATLASDKLAMKQKLAADTIPVPPFQTICSARDLDTLAAEWGYPLVIKPNDGRGARGVLRINRETDTEWAYRHALENSEQGVVICEKFISGRQLSTESMVYQKRCYTACISSRNYELLERCAPYIIENGGVIPADLHPEEWNATEEIVARAAESLGIENGTVKGDIVLSERGPVAIEMAARLSGGYLCTDQIPLARGVDLVKQTIKLALGDELNPPDLIAGDLCKIGIRYFFPEPGRVVDIRGFDELDGYPWISKKMLLVEKGDVVEAPTNHTKRVGLVHTTGRTFQEAEQRAISAANQVKIVTVPC